jgi:hypothetical protein
MTNEEFKIWKKYIDIWKALVEKPDALYKIWDDLPYSIIEAGLVNVSENIKLQQREDNYSMIVEDICDSCLEKGKVSLKQCKCVLDYAANYNNNNLKYKYKN